ncbi:MAG: ABC transporter permease [Halanaerobiales bacterium]
MKILIHWVKNNFKWQLKALITWSLILGVLSFFIGWAYQPFSESGYFELVENLPEYMKNAFLGGAGVASSLEGFLTMEYFSWMGLMFAFFPFVVATSAIAGDIENNTIEALMSKPLSRAQFYWGKFIVLTIATLLFILFNFFSLGFGLLTINQSLSFFEWAGSFSLMALSTLCFVALSFFFSAIFNNARQAMTLAIGLGIFMYLFNMIASAVSKPGWGKWTIFYHTDVEHIFTENTFPWLNGLFILILGIIFALAGWIIFNRKDISG